MTMPETTRFTDGTDAIELGFVDRVFTPKWVMKLAIELHLSVLSLSNTDSILDTFGVHRCRSTVHNWVQKADLEPQGGREPTKIALDETAVKVDGDRFWFVAAVDPNTNRFLHVGRYSTRTTVPTKLFLQELQEKHAIDDAEFFVDGAPWLQAGLFELGMHFQHETHGDRNPVERAFQEIKRRTDPVFYNDFPNANPATDESWLCARAWAQNHLI